MLIFKVVTIIKYEKDYKVCTKRFQGFLEMNVSPSFYIYLTWKTSKKGLTNVSSLLVNKY